MAAFAVAAALGLFSRPGLAETFILTTLDWCPYTCLALPGGGATTEVVRSALRATGHELKVEVLPWNRAIQTARRDPRYAGYFPEYIGDVPGFTLSNAIGFGPLGVAEHREHPLDFRGVDDLAAYRLGTVRGYINTAGLDAAIAAGRQAVEENVSDEANLLKLAMRRIDGAVIDGRVMAYLLAHEPGLKAAGAVLRFNGRTLEKKSLHVAVAHNEAGHRMADALKRGLGLIDANAVQNEYFQFYRIDLGGLTASLPQSPAEVRETSAKPRP